MNNKNVNNAIEQALTVNFCYEEPVDCTICGNKTIMTGTKLCDRCWELKSRIEMNLDLAKEIIANFESAEQGGRVDAFVGLRLDNLRKKMRIFCFDKSFYRLFLWLSTKDEIDTLNEGLKFIKNRRKILQSN